MDRHLAEALMGEPDSLAGEDRTAYFRALAEALPHTLWLATAEGTTLYVNARGLEFVGLQLEDVAGMDWLDTIHPDDRAATMATMAAAVEASAPYELEHRVRRHDGVYFWHAVRAAPVFDADGTLMRWIGTSTDIDARTRSRAELTETSSRLEMLFACAPVGLCFLDSDLRYLEVNDALAEMNGV